MRNDRTIIFVVLGAILFAVAFAAPAHAQYRPLFKPGTAPASTKTPVVSSNTGSNESNNLGLDSDAAAQPNAASANGSLAANSSRTFANELLPTGLALGATLLAIVLARSAVKRFSGKMGAGKRPQGVVEILARYPVARGQQIILLKVGRRVIVTHQGAQGMQALSEFSSEADVADLLARCEAGTRAASPFSFDALLRQSGKSMDRSMDKSMDRSMDRLDGTPTSSRPSKSTENSAARNALPPLMRDAEIEMVDLTRARKGGSR